MVRGWLHHLRKDGCVRQLRHRHFASGAALRMLPSLAENPQCQRKRKKWLVDIQHVAHANETACIQLEMKFMGNPKGIK